MAKTTSKLLSTAAAQTSLPIEASPESSGSLPSGASPPKASETPALVKGVTAKNYDTLAVFFSKARGGTWYMISTENRILRHGDQLAETLHEWGAWRGYFTRLGAYMKVKLMDKLGYYQVPAAWPHEFQDGLDKEIYILAGNRFNIEWNERKHLERHNLGKAAERRAAAVASAKAKFPFGPNRYKSPRGHLGQPQEPRVYSPEEMAASRARLGIGQEREAPQGREVTTI